MNSNMIKQLDYEVLRNVYGNKFADTLKSLGIDSILDINLFVEENKRFPCISSIFLLGKGTVYDKHEQMHVFSVKTGNTIFEPISTLNGTLHGIRIFNRIPFGREYFYAKYNVKIRTE